jgi:hypothetical protein
MFPPFGFSIQEFFICYFYCQKTAFVCEFHHTLCGKFFFWQPSTTLVNMRFCTHVPNLNKNKKMNSGNPYLRLKMVFWASETLLSLSCAVEKNFLFDFERYDLVNGKE